MLVDEEALSLMQLRASKFNAAPFDPDGCAANPEGAVPDECVGNDLQCRVGASWLPGGSVAGKTLQECREICMANPACDYYGSWPSAENDRGAAYAKGTCRIWTA